MEIKPKCNTTYQYFGNNAVEVPVGESLTDVTCDIPLVVLIDRLQRGISTGLGTGLPMACDIMDGDESMLDIDTPHIVDRLDGQVYMRSKIDEYSSKIDEEKKIAQEKSKKDYDNYQRWLKDQQKVAEIKVEAESDK